MPQDLDERKRKSGKHQSTQKKPYGPYTGKYPSGCFIHTTSIQLLVKN